MNKCFAHDYKYFIDVKLRNSSLTQSTGMYLNTYRVPVMPEGGPLRFRHHCVLLSTYLLKGCRPWGCRVLPWHTQILADQLTLFQPGGTNYAHLITTGTPGFSDLPTALT